MMNNAEKILAEYERRENVEALWFIARTAGWCIALASLVKIAFF